MIPRTAADILAAAKRAPPPKPKKPKTEPIYATQLSRFSATQHSSSDLDDHHSGSRDGQLSVSSVSVQPASHLPENLEPRGGTFDFGSWEGVFEDTMSTPLEPFANEKNMESIADDKATALSCIEQCLTVLRDERLGPFDFILKILDNSNPDYLLHRRHLYKESSTKLFEILDAIAANDDGKRKLRSWLQQPQPFALVASIINDEMDTVQKAEKLPGIASITPSFIEDWTICEERQRAPCLTQLLGVAAQTVLAKGKNKKKTPETMCSVLIKQLSYQRSFHSLGFAAMFGLFLWTTGCARQTIEALHHCGLCPSYDSILNNISALASHCINLAVKIGSGMHVFCYDNVNLSTSIFVEQRGSSTPAKVTSGTFPILYEVCNGNQEDMKLAPIMERFRKAEGLSFSRDLRSTNSQFSSFQFQLKIVVIRVLTKYTKGFELLAKDPALQHTPRRPLPKGHITKQYPLRATTIEEATVDGNLLFHDDVYLTQLRRSFEGLSTYAIPSFNDQLTNSRIRSAQNFRAQDIDPWERREVLQLGFGLFHLCLNLTWALLFVHRGSLEQAGSLTYFFTLLNKARLGGEHPDYHTLLSALTQIHDGIILHAWQISSKHSDLANFAKSKPTPSTLLELAGDIILKYATPMERLTVERDEDLEAEDGAEDQTQPAPPRKSRSKPVSLPLVEINRLNPDRDKVHQNLRLLTRDLLYLAELIRAISDGDIGRIEDFFPQLAMMFRGAGSNNYSTEILHFIFNLKYVWTPGFANIMRDNMLINISGLDGHAMPIDENIEHLIGQLKNLLAAKGLESTWDRLGDISAAIDYLNKAKKKVTTSLQSSYKSSKHAIPDTTNLVLQVASRVKEDELLVFKEGREDNEMVKATVDLIATGQSKLKSSSIATFNRKMAAMIEGQNYEEETDFLPRIALGLGFTDAEA